MALLDIIIPVKNEEKNIEELVVRIHNSLEAEKIKYQILVIDDKSSDRTKDIVSSLSKKYPIKFIVKSTTAGKAYSVVQGAQTANSMYVVMIDGDLQYPPELIPQMYKKMVESENCGVVVANRTIYKSSRLRKIISKANSFVFGRLLFGFNFDIQSGLKLFRREIIDHIDLHHVYPWSIDLPLLFTAVELGYEIRTVEGSFEVRPAGSSKISLLSASLQIAWGALKLRLANRRVYFIASDHHSKLKDAGIIYKKKRYVTHSALPYDESAFFTLHPWQIAVLSFLAGFIIFGVFYNLKVTLIAFVAVLSFVYFIDVFFNLYLVLKSLHFPPEIDIDEKDVIGLTDSQLPVYSILCPLYREAHMIPHFLSALGKIDYPKSKLDVLLLLEEDDHESLEQVKTMELPSYVRTVVVPDSFPKTKPKACNYGISLARGEYVVIYDAEDIPDPLQLKKAYLAFATVGPEVACLQAKLNFYNPRNNFLTRFFTAEYSLWFDIVLPGLQSIKTAIPLGGTSNHFRLKDLHMLGGWDAFNVTEDCDLGARLFKRGYQTAIINSTTLEEANSRVGNWLRQRSRWIKGYIQTYLVHMRHPLKFIREYGVHALIFQLVVGGKIAFMIINPILWLATILYFTMYAIFGPAIESLYPTVVFYMAATSLVFGNFLFIYYYMIGCAKRGQWDLIKWVYLVPFYWLGVSVAAAIAFVQLIIKPHYWEKTHHGFHLQKKIEAEPELAVEMDTPIPAPAQKNFRVTLGMIQLVFLGASMGANILNFALNALLGRVLVFEEFGVYSLMTNIFYLTQIPLGALGATMTFRSGYLKGKYGRHIGTLWMYLMNKLFPYLLVFTGLWIVSVPLLVGFFNSDNPVPFILFTPVILMGALATMNNSFLAGILNFGTLSILILVEALVKLSLTILAYYTGINDFIYAALPIALTVSFLLGYTLIKRNKSVDFSFFNKAIISFPWRFYVTSFIGRISAISFLSLDLILAKHFLNPVAAGHYSILSLVGKMVFFFGALFSQLIGPMVSVSEGSRKSSTKLFEKLFGATFLFCAFAFLTLGVFGRYTLPVLLGDKVLPVLGDIPIYVFAMALFTLSQSIVAYLLIRRKYLLSYLSFVFAVVQVVAINTYHTSPSLIAQVMLFISVFYFVMAVVVYVLETRYGRKTSFVKDLAGLFTANGDLKKAVDKNSALNILIFNWRDTKHVWAGGAENYIAEIAKHWVALGHRVTVFCGNDKLQDRNEVVEGVQIVRRGGFYTVYIWAFLYYVLRFRGLFDVVVDSENGIPFFTPMYVGKPKILLIHHIHQEVFRAHLSPILSFIASFLETKLMPLLYKNTKVVTVSDSSKQEIVNLKFWEGRDVEIVNPGTNSKFSRFSIKTSYPSFLYLGRLKPYKNLDVLIKSFARILSSYPKAKLTIAGSGESYADLVNLATQLGISSAVEFPGKIEEKEKFALMARSWVFVHPSMIEGWGITVIEANSCGTPVIASNVSGLRDSVLHNKTGVLVPVGNVSTLTNSMNMLVANPSFRVKLSREAYLWSKKFSWSKSAEEFLRIIIKEISDKHAYAIETKFAVGKA